MTVNVQHVLFEGNPCPHFDSLCIHSFSPEHENTQSIRIEFIIDIRLRNEPISDDSVVYSDSSSSSFNTMDEVVSEVKRLADFYSRPAVSM